MNKTDKEQKAPATEQKATLPSDSAYVQDQRAEQAPAGMSTGKVEIRKPVMKYAVLAVADRLEKQYLQGIGDVAVAEAVKALRKLADA